LGDDLGFLTAIQNLLRWWRGPSSPIERLVKTAFNQTLTKLLHRPGPAAERIGDPGVGPARSVCISLKQHLGPPNFLACPFEFSDHLFQGLTFFITQSNNVLLLHRATSLFSETSRTRG
jgi:hypothetical protein